MRYLGIYLFTHLRLKLRITIAIYCALIKNMCNMLWHLLAVQMSDLIFQSGIEGDLSGLPTSSGFSLQICKKMLLSYFCLWQTISTANLTALWGVKSACAPPSCIHMISKSRFCFSSGPGTCCPSSHVQEFRGNSVSYAKRGQPTETREKRLGHPSNQCPWELAGPIPTRASPGNVFDSAACMHTHTSLVAFKRDSLCLIWQPCRLTIALSCVQGDGERTDVRRVSFTTRFYF